MFCTDLFVPSYVFSILRVFTCVFSTAVSTTLQSRICRIYGSPEFALGSPRGTKSEQGWSKTLPGFLFFQGTRSKLIESRLLFEKLPQISRRICRIFRIWQIWRIWRVCRICRIPSNGCWDFFLELHRPKDLGQSCIVLGPRCRSVSWVAMLLQPYSRLKAAWYYSGNRDI